MKRCPLLYYMHGNMNCPPYVTADGFSPPFKCPADGPEDLHGGQLCTPCEAGYDLQYLPDVQTWIELKGRGEGRLFVGVDRESVISPAEVARTDWFGGHGVKMLGAEWIIPVARLAAGGVGLPQRRVLMADGSLGWDVDVRFRRLTEYAETFWNSSIMRDGSVLTDDQADETCAAALGVNYRIGIYEAAALQMVGTEELIKIMRAIVDWPTIEKYQKELDAQKKTLGDQGC